MDTVRAACRDLLRTHGPMPLPDLARHLSAEGHELGEDLTALDHHLFSLEVPEWSPVELADGRVADADRLLDRLVLTTALTAAHVDDGQPTVSPDLDPLL